MSDIYDLLLRKVREAVAAVWKDYPKNIEESDEQHFVECMRVTSIVLATEIGYMAGLAALGGIPKDARDQLVATHILCGKRIALLQHSEECEECEAAQALKVEIEAN